MRLHTTTIRAICPHTGEFKTYEGPQVIGTSFDDAQKYCDNNGLGYCKVESVLVAEIPVKRGTTNEPDFNRMIDYEDLND
jgi:hypothetical protein